MKNKSFTIAGTTINPGERKTLELSAPSLCAQVPINIPLHIFHGKVKGPRLFILAAIHGDEINGVEIIQRILRHSCLKHLHGTLLAIPITNVYGFMTLSRYLPDRRDLNRSFPGSKTGSLTARLAHLFMTEIVSQCTHGIDLHTGNIHTENLPHIRANLDISGTIKMAKAFNTPVIIDAKLLDGSLRQAASELSIPVIVYEGGEALHFNELSIRMGIRGILNVLQALGMIATVKSDKPKRIKSIISHYSSWVRSPESGIFHPWNILGSVVKTDDKIGTITEPFSTRKINVYAPVEGIIIGRSTLPLVNEGDILIHIAKLKDVAEISSQIEQFNDDLGEHLHE